MRNIEKTLTELFNSGHWLTTTSGLTALQVALYAAGVKRGDIVACDPYLPYSAMSVLNMGCIPVFYEIDFSENFRANIKNVGQRATILTSYFGNDAKVIPKCDLGALIVDRSQCFGPFDADFSFFATTHSFQNGKHVECGHGGGVCFSTLSSKNIAQEYISIGWRREEGEIIDWQVDPMNRSVGISARMSPILENYLFEKKDYFLDRANALSKKSKTVWNDLNLEDYSPWTELCDYPWRIPIYKNSIPMGLANFSQEVLPMAPAHFWSCFKKYNDLKSAVDDLNEITTFELKTSK